MEAAGTSIGSKKRGRSSANKEIKRRKRKMNQGLEDEKPRFPLQTRLGLGVLFPLSKEQLKKDKEVVDVATKIDLMKQSQFYRFINNGSQRPNSLPFFLAIVNRYDRQEKAFDINGKKMTITVDDVAYLLGLESEGNKPRDTKTTVECELHFDSLNHKYCLEGYDTNEKQLERLNILNILKLMKAESEEEKLWFRKLLSFYIISFVVYPTSSTSACFAKFSLVQDLDEFEKVNWAQVILDQLLDFVSGYEGKDNVNKMTYVFCLVILLEAWFYMKIGIEHVKDTRDSDAAPIYKYLGKLYLRMESCNAILDDCSSIKPMSKPREKKKKNLREKKKRQSEHVPAREKMKKQRECTDPHAYATDSHAHLLDEAFAGITLRYCLGLEKDHITENFFYDEEWYIMMMKEMFCENINATDYELLTAIGKERNESPLFINEGKKYVPYSRRKKQMKPPISQEQNVEEKQYVEAEPNKDCSIIQPPIGAQPSSEGQNVGAQLRAEEGQGQPGAEEIVEPQRPLVRYRHLLKETEAHFTHNNLFGDQETGKATGEAEAQKNGMEVEDLGTKGATVEDQGIERATGENVMDVEDLGTKGATIENQGTKGATVEASNNMPKQKNTLSSVMKISLSKKGKLLEEETAQASPEQSKKQSSVRGKQGRRRTRSANTKSSNQDSEDASNEKVDESSEKDGPSRKDDTAVDVLPSTMSDDQPLAMWFEGMHPPSTVDMSVAGACVGVRTKEQEIKRAKVVGSGDGESVGGGDIGSLPFVKESPVWETIGGMEVFRMIPQKPHFRPLVDGYKESVREGLAVGSMVTFGSVVEKTGALRFDDDRSTIEDYLENLVELESHGFNVKVVRDRLMALLLLKSKNGELNKKLNGIRSRIEEQSVERSKVDEEIEEIDRLMWELSEKRSLAVSKKEMKSSEITGLEKQVVGINEGISGIRSEFEELASSPWQP